MSNFIVVLSFETKKNNKFTFKLENVRDFHTLDACIQKTLKKSKLTIKCYQCFIYLEFKVF